jgi:uncharacterized protein (DUF2267 family)
MSGIQTLDNAVGATEEWINALMARLGWQDKERTYLALLAALHALRDALPRDEAGYLGVQLPVLLRGLYFEGWHPASHIQRAKSRSAFVERIQEGASGSGHRRGRVAHAVFALLAERLPPGDRRREGRNARALRMFWAGLTHTRGKP